MNKILKNALDTMREMFPPDGKVSGYVNLPEGFDGVFLCEKHPEREAAAPIALRKCKECLEDSWERWADHSIKYSRPEDREPHHADELTPYGITFGQAAVFYAKETIVKTPEKDK